MMWTRCDRNAYAGARVITATALTLTLALAAVAQEQPSSRRERVDVLASKSDPGADDWQTEILHSHAKHQLKRLATSLSVKPSGDEATSPVSKYFTPDARIARLMPSAETVLHCDRFRVRRSINKLVPELTTPDRSLDALMDPFKPATGLRIAFKIVAVAIVDQETFTTTTLYQAFGQTADSPIQQNAEWMITWKKGVDPDHPLIHDIRLSAYHDIAAAEFRFTECTGSVITDEELWRTQLLRGGEHWYGKTDAVGQLNYLGHQGIAVGDVNGDGLDDLYVGMGTGVPNKLFIQNPDGTVRETAQASGVAWLDDTKGVLLVDIDNDGDQDLLIAMGPAIVHCQNDSTGVFTPVRALRAATDASFYSLAAADYDLDGDLDIYACRYVKTRYGQSVPMPFHDANNGPPNHLLRNDGPAGFTDVTFDVGLNVNNSRFSLAAAWADYDDDGDPDIYVANDFGRNNLYRNDSGRFTDVAAVSGTEDQAAGMGVAWSDYDLDGDLDLCVSNMFSSAGQRIAYQPRFKREQSEDLRRQIQHHSLGNSLFASAGDGTFRDVGARAGVRMGRWSWGTKFVDFDNDGYDDLIVPNGFLTNELPDDL